MVPPRREYSLNRIGQLASLLEPVHPLLAHEPICLYATGSLGRLEAWDGSDADLFFLHAGRRSERSVPWTTWVRLTACLIDAGEALGFPPFTGDGRYLEVLYAGDMEDALGSPQDDSTNAFTARMLLLAESRPVYGEDLHAELLERVIGFYYRDFDERPTSFVPGFLINDILRFWRTLTLNYEHHRLRLRDLGGATLEDEKASSALKNYKLKVSRMSTCFSLVANLAAEQRPVRAETVLELCRITPAERFQRLAGHSEQAAAIVASLATEYAEFLRRVQRPREVVLAELADPDVRRETLRRAAGFGRSIYELLGTVASPDRMRYLVV